MPYFTEAESSAVSYVRYDRKHQRLYVTFRDSGEMYVYVEVPPDQYEALLRAESKGRFMNDKIKDRYKFQRLKNAS